MPVTERDRLIALEGEVARLKSDLLRSEADRENENREIRDALYGKGPNDKNAICAQLASLQSDRAIRIWFVSICAGIGSTVVAAIIINVLGQH